MPEQLLGDFDIDAILPEQIRHAVTERVPADMLRGPKTFKRRSYVPPQNHVRLERLLTILLN
jgi:hypothetical protein